jgi:hypothetical protein
VVEGKRKDPETEVRDEGNLGNPEKVQLKENIEKDAKGKEKIKEAENHAISKWNELVELVEGGVVNMRMMRDLLGSFKCKVERYVQKYGLDYEEDGADCGDIKSVKNGAKDGATSQVGPRNNTDKNQKGASYSGPYYRQPIKYYKNTYYRRKPRKRTRWQVKQRTSLASSVPEVPPEISQNSTNEFPLSADRSMEL